MQPEVRHADAIWRDDAGTVRDLITRNPALVHEHVRIDGASNWGPPMSYAATLGRAALVRLLHEHGARDLEFAAGRAALEGEVDTVRLLYELAGRPSLQRLSLAGPAYTLSVEGTAALLALGVQVVGPDGVDPNVMEHLLGT
ncbi:ankyrin repeat domain-containing protein, partial [Tolypothrix campylonemoides VB511288]